MSLKTYLYINPSSATKVQFDRRLYNENNRFAFVTSECFKGAVYVIEIDVLIRNAKIVYNVSGELAFIGSFKLEQRDLTMMLLGGLPKNFLKDISKLKHEVVT